MAGTQTKNDSAMEEVLASIKQIIAEDLDSDNKNKTSVSADDEVIELTDEIQTNDEVINLKDSKVKSREKDTPRAVTGEPLISEEVAKVSTDALKELGSYANVKSTTENNTPFGQRTVEDVVRETLRSLLKEWMDAHLPSLVKWLVAEQIEKLMKEQKG